MCKTFAVIGYDAFKIVVEGKNEILTTTTSDSREKERQKSRYYSADLPCLFHMKERTMSAAALVGCFDDIVRSAAILSEGIEGGKS